MASGGISGDSGSQPGLSAATEIGRWTTKLRSALVSKATVVTVAHQFHAVVLAAGASTRFGGGTHKALAPLVGSAGTLDLLLARLDQDARCTGVTVVTGAFAGEVEAACEAAHVAIPLRTVHNPEFSDSGLLHSLVLAVEELEPQNLWVFLADTYYRESFMERLWRPATAAAVVCVFRPDRPAGAPSTSADVPVAVSNGAKVEGIGPGYPREFEMAPAVGWSARSWTQIIAADAAGLRMQWQAIARLIDAEPDGVAALQVPAGSFFDVDTPEELARGRQQLACRGIGYGGVRVP